MRQVATRQRPAAAIKTDLKVGDRVKLSSYALETKRQWMLAAPSWGEKHARMGTLAAQEARRGTITAAGHNGFTFVLTVAWDGQERPASCLPHVVERA